MEQSKEDKRHHPRWVIEGRLDGRVSATYPATLIDLSENGAQIEHTDIVRPGTSASLTFLVHDQDLTLRCRVVWSRVHRPEMQAGGERELVYRTGLCFLEPSESSRRLLRQYIESLGKSESEIDPDSR